MRWQESLRFQGHQREEVRPSRRGHGIETSRCTIQDLAIRLWNFKCSVDRFPSVRESAKLPQSGFCE